MPEPENPYLVAKFEVTTRSFYQALVEIGEGADFYMSEDRCRESLAGASEGQIGLWAVLWYDGEVNNGGHWQFFDNSAGMIWKEVLFGFELIGDQERLDILRRACSLFPEGNPPCERHERSIALEIIECGKAKMNALDDEFYALSSDAFDGRMAGFIQAHPEQFFFPD